MQEKNPPNSEKYKIAQAAISYLNKKLGSNFSTKSKQSIFAIYGRINDGYALSDMQLVVDDKIPEWKGDQKMDQYLCPTTLFSAKHFEKYLQKAQRNSNASGTRGSSSEHRNSSDQIIDDGYGTTENLNEIGKKNALEWEQMQRNR